MSVCSRNMQLTDAEREKFIKDVLAKAIISIDKDNNMPLEPYRK